ncbi:MAG TPA: type II secretion system protein [Rhodocyclaceae bacterium]
MRNKTSLQLDHGFTLTEMAMVLVIVALLIGGLAVPLSAQQDNRNRADTDKALSDIREALIGFAVINGRLPCPAQASIASGTANAGLEATTGTGASLSCACTDTVSDNGTSQYNSGNPCHLDTSNATVFESASVGGVLPWATLGLPELDAWGQRYSYRVSTAFARGNTGQTYFGNCSPTSSPSNSAFALCSSGAMKVMSASSGGATTASGIPALVVSHGKNGAGAYLSTGTQSSATGDSNEQENYNGDATYVANTTIDDMLTWVPSNILMNRMLSAGKLP